MKNINVEYYYNNIILKLLRHSTVSAPIGFISEAVDDQVETSAMKLEMLQQSSLSCFCVGSRVLKLCYQ